MLTRQLHEIIERLMFEKKKNGEKVKSNANRHTTVHGIVPRKQGWRSFNRRTF